MRNPTALGSFNPTRKRAGIESDRKTMSLLAFKIVRRIQKPFRMISLRQIHQQLPWIDILTKNTGGWGYIPFYNPPIPANAAALGTGSNPFAAECFVPHIEPTS